MQENHSARPQKVSRRIKTSTKVIPNFGVKTPDSVLQSALQPHFVQHFFKSLRATSPSVGSRRPFLHRPLIEHHSLAIISCCATKLAQDSKASLFLRVCSRRCTRFLTGGILIFAARDSITRDYLLHRDVFESDFITSRDDRVAERLEFVFAYGTCAVVD